MSSRSAVLQIAPSAYYEAGCSDVDSLPRPHRRYFWIATFHYADSKYPHNHFRSVALDFGLPPDARPTSARLDSAFIENKPTAYEAVGEPPMVSRVDTIDNGYGNFTEIHTGGRTSFVVHLELNDSTAVRAVRSVGADSVWLGWCQRDGSSSSLLVPLVRR